MQLARYAPTNAFPANEGATYPIKPTSLGKKPSAPLPSFLKKLVPLKKVTRDLSGGTAATAASNVSDVFDDPFDVMSDIDDSLAGDDDSFAGFDPTAEAEEYQSTQGPPQSISLVDPSSQLEQEADAESASLLESTAASLEVEFLKILAQLELEDDEEEQEEGTDEDAFLNDSLRFVRMSRLPVRTCATLAF